MFTPFHFADSIVPNMVEIPVRSDDGRILTHIRYKGMVNAPRDGFDSLLAAFLAVPERGRLVARYMVDEPEEADDLLATAFPQMREKGLGIYDESKHPRDAKGKFVPKAALAKAARDPQELKRLQASITDPAERKKLQSAVQDIQGRVGKPGTNFMPQSVGRAVPGRQSVAETAEHIHRLRAEVGEAPPTVDHLRRLAALLAWHSVAELRELKGHLGVQVSGDPGKENAVANIAHRAMTWRQEKMEQVKAQRAKAQLTARLKAEKHTGTDEHGRDWHNGELVTGQQKPTGPAPVGSDEFDRRMASIDPRHSGAVDMPEVERPAFPDDKELAERMDAGARRQRMMEWHADRPESQMAEHHFQQAEDRVRRAGGGELFGEDDLPQSGGRYDAGRATSPFSAPQSQAKPATTPVADPLAHMRRNPAQSNGESENEGTAFARQQAEKQARIAQIKKRLAEADDLDGGNVTAGEQVSLMKELDELTGGRKPAETAPARSVVPANPQTPAKPASPPPAPPAPPRPSEPWQMPRREFMAKGVDSLAEDHPLMQSAAESAHRLREATSELMKAAGTYKKNNFDTATKKSTIGAAMEYAPHTIDTALKSTKVPREIKERYRSAKQAHDAASNAVDDATDHRSHVEAAVRAGKPVPPNVLADYPDINPAETAPARSDTPPTGGTDLRRQIADIQPGRSSQIAGHTVTRGRMNPDIVTVQTPDGKRRVDTIDGAAEHLAKLGGGQAKTAEVPPAEQPPIMQPPAEAPKTDAATPQAEESHYIFAQRGGKRVPVAGPFASKEEAFAQRRNVINHINQKYPDDLDDDDFIHGVTTDGPTKDKYHRVIAQVMAPDPEADEPPAKPEPRGIDGKTRSQRRAEEEAAKQASAPPVHPKAMEKYRVAVDGKDYDSLAGLLHPDNKGLRQMFEKEQGVKLPKTMRETHKFLANWVQQAGGTIADRPSGESPLDGPHASSRSFLADRSSLTRQNAHEALERPMQLRNGEDPQPSHKAIEQMVADGGVPHTHVEQLPIDPRKHDPHAIRMGLVQGEKKEVPVVKMPTGEMFRLPSNTAREYFHHLLNGGQSRTHDKEGPQAATTPAENRASAVPETPPAAPPDTGRSGKTLADLPPSIRSQVESAIGRHRQYADALEQGRKADRMFAGDGRYENDAHKANVHHLEAGDKTLDEFRRVAPANGFDPEAIIRELGGGDRPSLSQSGQDYDKPVSPQGRPSGLGLTPTEKPTVEQPQATTDIVPHPILDRAAEKHTDGTPGVFTLSDRDRFELAAHLDQTSDPGIADAALRGENIVPRLNAAIKARKPKLEEEKRQATQAEFQKKVAEGEAKRKAQADDLHGRILEAARKNPQTRELVHGAAAELAKGTKAAKQRAVRSLFPLTNTNDVHEDVMDRLRSAHQDGSLHEQTKPTTAGRLSFETEDGPEPTYPAGGSLFEGADDEVHEGPHHKAVNDLLTAAGRRFPETQIGPRARMADTEGELAQLDSHLSKLSGGSMEDPDEMPFSSLADHHQSFISEIDDGRYDDDHSPEDVENEFRQYSPGINLHLDDLGHRQWLDKWHGKHTDFLAADIRDRMEKRLAPKKAALAEKLKNPGALTEEEYDEHFPHQPWTHPSGAREWLTSASARKAMEELPADMEGRVSGSGRSWNVLARKRQDSHEGYDLSDIKDDILTSLGQSDDGRGISELRDELSSAKHDPNNPMAHPVHRAVMQLSQEGKVKVGRGSDPTVSLAVGTQPLKPKGVADIIGPDRVRDMVRGYLERHGKTSHSGVLDAIPANQTDPSDALSHPVSRALKELVDAGEVESSGDGSNPVYRLKPKSESTTPQATNQPTEGETAPARTEPWQMTRDEYRDHLESNDPKVQKWKDELKVTKGRERKLLQDMIDKRIASEMASHHTHVGVAKDLGRDVPPGVLAEYPHLQPKASAEPLDETATARTAGDQPVMRIERDDSDGDKNVRVVFNHNGKEFKSQWRYDTGQSDEDLRDQAIKEHRASLDLNRPSFGSSDESQEYSRKMKAEHHALLDALTGGKSKDVVAEYMSPSGDQRQYRVEPRHDASNGLHFKAVYDEGNEKGQESSVSHATYEDAVSDLGNTLADRRHAHDLKLHHPAAQAAHDEAKRMKTEAAQRQLDEQNAADRKQREEQAAEAAARQHFEEKYGGVKSKKGQVQLANRDGTKGEVVDGHQIGPFTVHKNNASNDKPYTVTHTKTGLGLGIQTATLAEAKKAAAIVGEHGDWNFDQPSKIFNETLRHGGIVAKAIKNGRYADLKKHMDEMAAKKEAKKPDADETATARTTDIAAGKVADMAVSELGVSRDKLMAAATALAKHEGASEIDARHVAEAAAHYQKHHLQGKRPEDEYSPGSPAIERAKITEPHLSTTSASATTAGGAASPDAGSADKPTAPWHGGREEVFEKMRQIEEEHERHRRNAQQFAPRFGQIGLGSQDFDHHLKAEVAMAFNRALNQGKTPQEATEYAKEEARATIKNWNTHGSKKRASISGNYEYQRDLGSGDTYAEDLGRRFQGIGDPGTPAGGSPSPQADGAENRASADSGVRSADLSKPAHEMSSDEFNVMKRKLAAKFRMMHDTKAAKDQHREEVRQAIQDGMYVPQSVLDEYPDLTAKAAEEPPSKPHGFAIGQTVRTGGIDGSFRGIHTVDGVKHAVIAAGRHGQLSVPLDQVEDGTWTMPDPKKEPHQQTWDERRADMLQGYQSGGRTKPTPGELKEMKDQHRKEVLNAKYEGRTIPDEVKAEYPEFFPEVQKQADLSALPAHVRQGIADHPGHHVIDSDGTTHTVYSPTGEKLSEGPHADLGNTLADLTQGGKKVAVLDRVGREMTEGEKPAKKKGGRKKKSDKPADDTPPDDPDGGTTGNPVPAGGPKGGTGGGAADGDADRIKKQLDEAQSHLDRLSDSAYDAGRATTRAQATSRHARLAQAAERRDRLQELYDQATGKKSVTTMPAFAMQSVTTPSVSPRDDSVSPSVEAMYPASVPQSEYVQNGVNNTNRDASDFAAEHRDAVESAIRLGHNIPDSVKADYPDLFPSAENRASADRQTEPAAGQTAVGDRGEQSNSAPTPVPDGYLIERKTLGFKGDRHVVTSPSGERVGDFETEGDAASAAVSHNSAHGGRLSTGDNAGLTPAQAEMLDKVHHSELFGQHPSPSDANHPDYHAARSAYTSAQVQSEDRIHAISSRLESMVDQAGNDTARHRAGLRFDPSSYIRDAMSAHVRDSKPLPNDIVFGDRDGGLLPAGKNMKPAAAAVRRAQELSDSHGMPVILEAAHDENGVLKGYAAKAVPVNTALDTLDKTRLGGLLTHDPSMMLGSILVKPKGDYRNGLNLDHHPADVDTRSVAASILKGGTQEPPSTGDTANDTPEPSSTEAKPADPNAPYSLAEHDATVERLQNGQITPDELRQAHSRLQQHRESVMGELKKYTVPQLKKLAGSWHANDMNKGELLDYVHKQMGEDLVPRGAKGGAYMIGPGYDVRKHQAGQLEKVTEDHIRGHAEMVKKAKADRQQATDEYKAKLENPQTLEDYRSLARARGGLDKLTPEELARHDELHAEKRRGRSMAERQEKAKISGFSGGEEAAGGINIVEGHHQKRNEKTHTVTVENRLGDEKFQEALSAAKRLGGSYVNAMIAKRYGATPGFQFFDRQKAEQFAAVLRGESVDRSAEVAGEMAARQQNRAGSLGEKAESLIGQGEESLGRERRTNTRRQAAMAASAEEDAREKIATGRTLQKISDGQANGTLKHLAGLRSAQDIHTLERALVDAEWNRIRAMGKERGKPLSQDEADEIRYAPFAQETFPHVEYPHPSAHQNELQDIAKALADEPGLKRFAEKMKKEGDPTANVKFQGSAGGMKTNGGTLLYDHHFRDHPEYTYIAHHMRGDGQGDKAVRVHASNDWRLARAAEKAGGSRSGPFYTADKGKSWAQDPQSAVLGALRRGHTLDHIDAPREKSVKFTDADDIEALRTAARKLRNHPNDRLRRIGQSLREKLEHHDRLKRADIHSLPELRAAIREYLPLKQQADREDPVKAAERELKGKDIPGFFPTPRPSIEEMLDRADIQPGHTVLEPSAGKGDILDAIRERHPEAQTHALEFNSTLRDILQKKGHNVVGHDALDHVGQYDRIVMNPPFEGRADAKHTRHAYENNLAPGGRMVAIMSEGPFSGSQKQDQEFREWLASVGGVDEPMPEGSFAGNDAFRKTGVRTRMVTIDKPAAPAS